ncbi:MAG: hypothetical protein KGI25_03405 [Thaumarchaeota archaeon]|nr:hypothetical protein [Nitrososphaerota archaeon]
MYDEPSVPQIKIDKLVEFIEKQIGIKVEARQNFLKHFNVNKKVFHDIASCRVFNPYVPFETHNPTAEEATFEEQETIKNIVLYDGFELANVFRDYMPDSELSQEVFHLIFTTRLTCSYDYDDYRYHGRAVICSNPSIISTTGIIEAPAKPRDYYLQMYEKISQGLNLDVLKNEFKGRYLEYNDSRLDLVVRGYALQAIFYYLTGVPFCESKDCVLYNAHWQEDLLYSQIEIGKLCKQHQTVLGSF